MESMLNVIRNLNVQFIVGTKSNLNYTENVNSFRLINPKWSH